MIQTLPIRRQCHDADVQWRRNWLLHWLWRLAFLGIVYSVMRDMMGYGSLQPTLGWLLYLIGVGLIILVPRYGVYFTLCFGILGDQILLPWFPFTKNFSSYESLLFFHNAAIINPAETYMVIALASWLGREAARRRYHWVPGPLFWPLMAFTVFITTGLMYGLARGGDRTIALWESRAIFYMPLMYVLIVHLIRTRAQLKTAFYWMMGGIIAKSIAGVWYVAADLRFNLSAVERIAEHNTSIFIDAAIIFAIAVWVYRCSWKNRLIFTLALPILLFALFANQRRASFLTLIIALILVAVIIFRERRIAFYLIVPMLSIVAAAYIAAFWNSTSPAGMPARAIRSVVDPTGGNARDQSSNLYRVLENINSMATIKSAPLTGVGFGNKFLIVVSMADISSFVWWQYITHNSIMWIWMKTGLGGIATLFFLVGYSLMQGARITWYMPPDEMGAIALTATLSILMHFMYAYVDISWVVQSMIFVGGAMGILGAIENVVLTEAPSAPLRWPWQTPRPGEPGLRLM